MPKYTLKPILFLIFFFLSKPLFAIDSIAETALVMDISTGEILLDKNSKMRTYPSSMTKIMTVLVAFEKIKNGTLSLDQEFLVSKKAWKKGGSKMFIEVDEE